MKVTAKAQRPRRRKKISYASMLIQTVFVLGFIALIAYFAHNALSAINARGMTTGFGFLERPRGWALPPSIFESVSQDSYLRTIIVGSLNTLMVGVVAIVLSTILGFLLGIAQVGNNFLLRSLAHAFVQIFRNVPTVVYVVFIFSVVLTLPPPRGAINAFDVAYLSNRGLLLPAVETTASFWVLAVATIFSTGAALSVVRKRKTTAAGTGLKHAIIFLTVTLLALVGLSAAFAASGSIRISIPQLVGFNFTGGMTLSVEVTTLVLALTIFGSAYIGEIVRGGLVSVSQGLTEAAGALGLKPWQVFFYVRLPVAMRSIIPALTNQYLYMMKATSLGIVIGFADLFSVANLSINYSGQTLEILGLMMAIFVVINFTMSRMSAELNRRLQFKTSGAER
ncbi:ABC transporter permease subunit [Phyllobacterium sp. YR531]|uniref:ABC transporter permease subunit n=1 Tax=Phyllobacterium sp. YR531 TaxID=1144343 RepID=UPI00026FBA52|nr:ABC transporter permease subunit [Phyllobacterium sp. YR531]EJN06747.1 ABC-type amino acid transport system, permease component [Phyllobacterium sp. YR531]